MYLSLERRLEGFNPLHCGAVVASPMTRRRGRTYTTSFNPLHCGAVVASSALSDDLKSRLSRFNPLHCGAVVASVGETRRDMVASLVSIPFIAGQWSLPSGSRFGVVS